ncbi:hypothetical protein ACSQ67_014961 [Phaseolus vulgaris]
MVTKIQVSSTNGLEVQQFLKKVSHSEPISLRVVGIGKVPSPTVAKSGKSSTIVLPYRIRVGVSPASWKCSEEFFSRQIKNRDPLKIGFSNILALRLVRRLLHWDPEDRPSIDEALQHPYFQHPRRE